MEAKHAARVAERGYELDPSAQEAQHARQYVGRRS